MLGHEIAVLAEPIARSFDLDDDGMVQKSVEESRGDDGVAEHLAPFREAAIGGEDHGTPLVAGVDELEEQVSAAGRDRKVSDLVHQQRGTGEEADVL